MKAFIQSNLLEEKNLVHIQKLDVPPNKSVQSIHSMIRQTVNDFIPLNAFSIQANQLVDFTLGIEGLKIQNTGDFEGIQWIDYDPENDNGGLNINYNSDFLKQVNFENGKLNLHFQVSSSFPPPNSILQFLFILTTKDLQGIREYHIIGFTCFSLGPIMPIYYHNLNDVKVDQFKPHFKHLFMSHNSRNSSSIRNLKPFFIDDSTITLYSTKDALLI